MNRRRSSSPALWVLAISWILVAAGCGGDDEATTQTAPRATVEESTVPQPTASQPTAPSRLASTAAPSTTSAGSAETTTTAQGTVRLGVERLIDTGFAPLGDGRKVALITNQVSLVDGRHLIDLMAEAPTVDLVRIFAAEHGVRGVSGAGEPIGDSVDAATGVPILSLYGATRQPTPEMLVDVDTIVFDLQDVGTRYYTYTATMGLAMQAAARAEVEFIVLDRPNPLGRLVEGDLRDDAQVSFISQYPTPSLHGLTAGELARMIVGEAWLPDVDQLDLRVVETTGWSGESWLDIDRSWIPPSPGLQTIESAVTYPAMVWFEATSLSYGAGTDLAFRAVGAPWLDAEAVVADLDRRGIPGVEFRIAELAPTDIENIAVDPRFEGEIIPGVELVITDVDQLRPSEIGLHLLDAVMTTAAERTVIDRPAVFDLLAGTPAVRQGLEDRLPVAEIVEDWGDVAAEFEARSAPFRLYP